MSLQQWIWVFSIAILVIPLSIITKLLIFKVFKISDGENELEENLEISDKNISKKSFNKSKNNLSKISETISK